MVESFCQYGLVFLAAVNSIQLYVKTGHVDKLCMASTDELRQVA